MKHNEKLTGTLFKFYRAQSFRLEGPMWVVEKIRVSVERSNLHNPSAEFSFKIGDIMFGEKVDKPRRISRCPNVITPDNIPEFCIPPTIPSLQEMKNTPLIIKASPCERTKPETEVTHHDPLNSHIIQVESVDESPNDGCSDEETTNADPQSQAALSLPHLAKAHTCYGFCTLLESPHTRRKESLFHSDTGSSQLLLPRSRSSICSKISPSSSPSSVSLNSLTSRLYPRGCNVNWQGTLDSDTTSSTESSPFSSPLLTRCPAKSSLFKALSHELLMSRNMRKAMVSRNNSLSTDEGSSTDNSPNVMRRASDGLTEGLPSSYSLAPPNIFPMDLTLHRERAMKERMVPIGKDGSLRLSAEYCTDNQRLRVRLISAEGLYPFSVDPKIINCSVSLSLVPGKIQKQRSTVIRKSRNPIFNEDFFFDGISEEDLSQRSLRFKVVNKMSTLKRDYLLGDCDLPLSSIVTL
ncbi:C2 calcium-dependent domain-containing protein 4C Nuclear-localized factor 3 Protein FAM148C [Channa argus]|uniref:C2 calcium-dependent domain-containing protein 4C Nuclear-localized factor 3 Protein FAM148C n=2 Tax=Channa argus TaxID=215402 RepID=A0A6G1PF34_CHAAH|nr:C2 calcium-dependent domain-containing protein 4C Nuclear-localized factor 3 Protein FAM148C [Channa argus]